MKIYLVMARRGDEKRLHPIDAYVDEFTANQRVVKESLACPEDDWETHPVDLVDADGTWKKMLEEIVVI
jgi:hypothetical protein